MLPNGSQRIKRYSTCITLIASSSNALAEVFNEPLVPSTIISAASQVYMELYLLYFIKILLDCICGYKSLRYKTFRNDMQRANISGLRPTCITNMVIYVSPKWYTRNQTKQMVPDEKLLRF